MNSPLTLSVIVVNWNVRDLLRNCLRSLHEQMLMPAVSWELIVVDNHSEDGSVAMVREEFPAAVLLANDENLGFGKANNQAYRTCRGRYVLLLNPDTVVLDHAADRMVEMMGAHREVAAVGCSLMNSDGSFQRWTGGHPPDLLNVTCHFLFAYKVLPACLLPPPLYLEREPRHDIEVGWVSGACMLLRREALGDQIFDERFFLYGEDLELCDRLVRGGWRVVYTPRVRIIHHEGRSLEGQTADVQASKVRNLRQVFAMHHGRAALLFYDLVVAVGFLQRCLLFTLAALWRRGYRARASRSRRYLGEAVRALVRR